MHYQHHQQLPPPQQQLFAPTGYKTINYGQPIASASAQPIYSQIAPQHAIHYGAHMNYQPTMGRFHFPQQKFMY